MGGSKDWSENLQNNQTNTISKTESVEELSAMAIKNNFLMLQKEFLQKNWDSICKYSPVIKSLLEIPELQDIKLDNISMISDKKHMIENYLFIETSIDYDGNLYQFLLGKGFSTEIIQPTIRSNLDAGILFCYKDFQLFLKQENI